MNIAFNYAAVLPIPATCARVENAIGEASAVYSAVAAVVSPDLRDGWYARTNAALFPTLRRLRQIVADATYRAALVPYAS